MVTARGAGETRILVVEDDATVAEVVTRYLAREGFQIVTVGDGESAILEAGIHAPDLVLLDLMLPKMDGFEVCRRLRAERPVPVVMLTARGEEDDRIAGLELGADDYVTKPFSPRELVARVKAVLRRSRALGGVPGRVRAGDVSMDLGSREVTVRGLPIVLTPREFDLLEFLARHPGRVFRREELLEHVWGFTYGDTSTVTVHIRRLREKVERDAAHPIVIVTVWGVGYRFDA